MKIFKRIVAGVLFVVFIVAILMIALVPEKATENIAPAVVSLILGVILWASSNKQPTKKASNPKPIFVTHVEGLPLAEKTFCTLSLIDDSLVISGGGNDFVIKISQIGAAEIKTDVEISHIVTSSVAKGIAGGLLFGPVGLVIGSRAKSKEKRTAIPYLILNYTNAEGVLSSMMFEASSNSWGLNKFLNNLRSSISNNHKHTVQL